MDTETEILKRIWGNKGKPIGARLIGFQTGFGLDYLRYICENLLRKDLIRRKTKDLYLISYKGQKELERRGLVKISRIKIKKKENPFKQVKIAIVNTAKSPKIKFNTFSHRREEKLSIGKKVERAILALERLRGGKEKR